MFKSNDRILLKNHVTEKYKLISELLELVAENLELIAQKE